MTILSIIGVIIWKIALWMLFEKAGVEGWKALIPFYSAYKLCEIAVGNGWYILLMLIPPVCVFMHILLSIKLAKAFGKETITGILLAFLPVIFIPGLGFGKAKYVGPQQLFAN